jgi:hypothetical protein
MAKQKIPESHAPTPVHPSQRVMLGVLAVVGLLFIIAIVISMNNKDDNLTAWATIKSRELHNFMSDCRSTGGVTDVRPNAAPMIVFICEYTDRTVEYTLEPGK